MQSTTVRPFVSQLNLRVEIHPSVLFQICDLYERRPRDKTRICGTLLGKIEKDLVEVNNCFSVPYAVHSTGNDADCKVDVALQYVQDMIEMNKRLASSETVVGWFATDHTISASFSAFIHEYYVRHCKQSCVHVTVETSLNSDCVSSAKQDEYETISLQSNPSMFRRISMRSYILESIGVPGGSIGSKFSRIPVRVASYEAERSAVQALQVTKTSKMRQTELPEDMTVITSSINKIMSMLSIVSDYVDAVVSGEVPGDKIVGRKLLRLANSTPHLDTDTFEKIMNDNIKDSLMIEYLIRMVQAQLQINEKLTTISVNQLQEFQKLLAD